MAAEAIFHLVSATVLGSSPVPDPEEAPDKHWLNWIDYVLVPWFYDLWTIVLPVCIYAALYPKYKWWQSSSHLFSTEQQDHD